MERESTFSNVSGAHLKRESGNRCQQRLATGGVCGGPVSPRSAASRCEWHRRLLVAQGKALGFHLLEEGEVAP